MPNQKWKLTSLLLLMSGKVFSLDQSPGTSSKRSSCLSLVAQSHFRSNSTVAVITTELHDYQRLPLFGSKLASVEDNLMQQLSVNSQFSVVTLTPAGMNSSCLRKTAGRKRLDYFVFSGSANEVINCIATFCFKSLTTSLTQFVVYLETTTINARRLVQDTLNMFWKHQQYNVVVLVGNQQEEISIYRWFPFTQTPEAKLIEICNGTVLRHNRQLFQPELPHDFKGKVISVGLVVAPMATCDRIGPGYAGIEIDILESMASILNLTVYYRSSDDLSQQNNSDHKKRDKAYGPWGTVLVRLFAGEVDIAMGGFIMTAEATTESVEYTQPYTQDVYTFFATDDKVLSGRTEIWIGLILLEMTIVFTFTTIAMHLLSRPSKGRSGDCGDTAIMVWSLLTDTSVKVLPMSSRQILLWTVCAFYAINLNTVNKSVLTSRLASPIYVENIRTVTDMVESQQPFLLGSAAHIDDIPVLSPSEVSKLQKRVVPCPEPIPRCLLKLVSVPQYCLSASEQNLKFLESILPNRQYHSLNRTIAILYPTIYTTKNFFLARKMTMMVLRSVQAGLVDFWHMKTLRNHNLCDLTDPDLAMLRDADANRSVSVEYSVNAHRPYSMTSLYPQFLLLGFGLFFSGVAFGCEFLYWLFTHIRVCCPCSAGREDIASKKNLPAFTRKRGHIQSPVRIQFLA